MTTLNKEYSLWEDAKYVIIVYLQQGGKKKPHTWEENKPYLETRTKISKCFGRNQYKQTLLKSVPLY